MWDCLKCGCLAIARDLGFCPQCFEPKEDDVPKATSAGASNAAALPGEPGYIEPEKPAEANAEPAADEAEREPEKPAEPPALSVTPKAAAKGKKAAATGAAPAGGD